MNYDLIEKIASKMVLAFRELDFFDSYAEGINKGIIFYNYFYFPVACAYKKRSGYYFITCYDNKQSYERVFESACKNAKRIVAFLNKNGNNLNNFMKKVKEIFQSNGVTEQDDFLVSSIRKVDYNELMRILTGDYDTQISLVEKLFGDKTNDINIFKFGGFTFKSLQKIDKKEIRQKYNELIMRLPQKLKSELLYGIIELRTGFGNDIAALWVIEGDYIVLNLDNDDLIRDFIHELGHRWYYKFASKQQLDQFKKLYDDANGKNINLEIADIITFKGDDQQYIYAGMDENGKMLLQSLSMKASYHRKINIRDFDTINGQKIKKYDFPSNYAKTKFDEFVPECIAYCYCNELQDKRLARKIKKIVEEL